MCDGCGWIHRHAFMRMMSKLTVQWLCLNFGCILFGSSRFVCNIYWTACLFCVQMLMLWIISTTSFPSKNTIKCINSILIWKYWEGFVLIKLSKFSATYLVIIKSLNKFCLQVKYCSLWNPICLLLFYFLIMSWVHTQTSPLPLLCLLL